MIHLQKSLKSVVLDSKPLEATNLPAHPTGSGMHVLVRASRGQHKIVGKLADASHIQHLHGIRLCLQQPISKL